MLDDPLENKRLLELVGTERRKKVIRYRMPDDRKRSVGAGIIINKILDENGLSESCLKYSENGKPVADTGGARSCRQGSRFCRIRPINHFNKTFQPFDNKEEI